MSEAIARENMSAPSYTYQTAAEWLNISPRKLHRLVEIRKIPFVKMEREIRFRLEDLENYLTRCIRPVVYEAGVRLTPPPGVGTSQR
jgi:excisionase family DNA binding protein